MDKAFVPTRQPSRLLGSCHCSPATSTDPVLTTPAEGETVPTMRLTWDQLAKEIIPSVLAGVGHVQTSVEAQTDTQFVDLYVTPENDVDWTEAFQRLGWLAKMAQQPSIIEPYSTTCASRMCASVCASS